ncbi:MAG: [protein-PII] uridylyltransferase [Pseudomonadota bacterium]
MGYTDHAGTSGVERLMKHYYLVAKDVGDLTRILCAALEAEHQRRPRLSLTRLLSMKRVIDDFPVEGGRISVPSESFFSEQPVQMLKLFHIAQEYNLDIHPDALRLVTQNLRRVGPKLRDDPDANRLFIQMLTSKKDPETTLRRMNEAGLFGRFIPDFGRVVAQMQYDMYHVYTVDEHTIFALGILHRIEQGLLQDDLPVATSIIHKVVSREVLYVAVLLHDIAKGRKGDHSIVGAKIARTLCPRLGFSPEDTETVAWLVLNHLLMSMTAQKRDLDDPKTVLDFAEAVQSPERLRLLLVLTVADIRAVGPNTWTQWKANLLRQLYHQTMEALDGGLSNTAYAGEQRRAAAIAQFREHVPDLLPDVDTKDIDSFVESVGPSYWLAFEPANVAQHVRMVREVRRGEMPLSVQTVPDVEHGVTAVTVLAEDHPGLLPQIAGALAISGASIVEARIFTLSSGYALDVFTVQDGEGGSFDQSGKIARFVTTLQNAIDDDLDLSTQLDQVRGPESKRRSNFDVIPRVIIDNNASEQFTVVEINGLDQPGFLFRITKALTDLSLQISSARISTYGERAVDVFYVKDQYGFRITHPKKLARVKEILMAAIPTSSNAAKAGTKKLNDKKLSDKNRGSAGGSYVDAAE